MKTAKRIPLALALIVGAAAWSWLLAAMARQSGHAPAAHVSLPDLDKLEARMLHAAELTRRWEYLAERHREAAPVVCEHLADAASRKHVP